jgi:hypothetical protein
MKLLAAADLHGFQYRLNLVLKNVERYTPDLVIICGDITQFGPGEVAKNFLEQIPVTTLALPGNIDSDDVDEAIDNSKAINIEMKKIVKDGVAFVGISSVDCSQFIRFDAKNLLTRDSVLVSHVPPYGLQDKVFIGFHSGSKELRTIIHQYKPRLVLCGHIHEDTGIAKTNGTVVVNCSMGKRGEGALIELNKDVEVIMLG